MNEAAFDFELSLSMLAHLLGAYFLALPIAIDREQATNSAGLRTFPLVAVCACALVLLGMSAFKEEEPQARVIYALITGLGFIGGGAILKTDTEVSGTATAASIWNTGAIGIAVGWAHYDLAIFLSVINVATLWIGRIVKSKWETGATEQETVESRTKRPKKKVSEE